ncbi:MAG: Gfo/Idh/MocA family oxidoreductase [Candidatus Phosphoribacter sp.]|nr:Gfo/Idh/MocA family oxidoreductase [Actinomycetales bacterium]
MPARLRVALVGSGSMGLNHARVIATGPRTTLTVVIDPSETAGRGAADRHEAHWAPDLQALDGVDAAVLAAPTEHHLALALPIIAAGLPLLIEKPVCPSLADTVAVVDASRRAGTPLQCGLLERFNPAFATALRMVDAPLFVRSERHSPYAARIKTGVGWDLLVHDVDLVVQTFGGGSPAEVFAQVGRFHPDSLPHAEDLVETMLRFPDGGMASVSASRIGQRKVRMMVIQELDRMIEVDLLRRGVTAYRHTTIDSELGFGGYRQRTEIEVPEIVGVEPLVSQLEHFVDVIEGRVDQDAERASILPVHEVVDQVLRSGRS